MQLFNDWFQRLGWGGIKGFAPLAWRLGAIALAVVLIVGCSPINVSDTESGSQGRETSVTAEPSTSAQSPSEEDLQTPQPTLTPTVPVMTPTPANFDFSVLTAEQRERLYEVSLNYLADTEEEAIEVAQSLNYIDQWAHPATFCGPLSIGILQQAGLVDRTVDLHDFWLLNPRDEFTVTHILEKAFPTEDYFWYQTTIPLNEFDFNEFPLFSGDFLYLYAGPAGTFEHMLTVSRVDEAGRVYAISAEIYSGEYEIHEMMLYDPQNPGTGFFYDLTNRENMWTTGLTGFGGFQLWRPITPIGDLPAAEQNLQERLDGVFAASEGEWHVLVKEVGGDSLYALHEDSVIHPGSVIKVPLAILFFKSLHPREIVDLLAFLNEHGTNGRTYAQLLEAMLVVSEEVATEALFDYTKSEINIPATLAEWGYPQTVISPRETTAAEMGAIFEDLWTATHVSDEEREIIKAYLSAYTEGDDGRIGVIREAMPDNVRFYSKRGSLADGRVIVAEVAVIEFKDRAYIISMYGYPNRGESKPTYEVLEATIEDAAWIIWDALQTAP